MPLTITTLEPFNLNNSATFTFASTSVTSNVVAGNIKTDNLLYANGTAWSFGGTYSNTNVAAYLPTYTGNVSANYFIGNGATLTNITGSNVTGYVPNANIANSATTAGTVTTNAQPNITSVGTLSSVSVTGNITSGNANLGNLVVANYFSGDGSLLTGISGTYSNANVAAYLPTYTGNVSANYFIGNGATLTNITGSNVTGYVPNANLANTATSATTAGTVTTNAQPNITSIGTLSSLSVTGNITAGNANVSGTMSVASITTIGSAGNITGADYINANFYIGNGSLLTGLPASYSNTNVAAYLPTYTGNLVSLTGAVTTTANITANYFIGNGSQLTGLPASYSNTNVAAYLPTYTGNFTAGNANVSGNIIAGNFITSGSGGNISDANYVIANYFSGNGSLLTGISGTYSNSNVANYLPTYTGNVSANYFIGNGATLTNITGSNVSGNVASAVQSHYANIANSVAGANVSGQVSNALIAGTVYTNAQPNITSTGTLLGLSVTGNLNITGNINATGNLNYQNVTDLVVGDPLIFLGANNTGNLVDLGFIASYDDGTGYHTGLARDATDGTWKLFDQVVAEPTTTIDFANGTYAPFRTGSFTSTSNITAVNASLGNLTTSNYFSGNGSLLTSITGSNVTGYVPNANIANSATTAGTVTTNAQPNITSVGTLSSLDVTSNVSAGNIKSDNLLYANGTAWTFSGTPGGSNTQIQFNDGNSFAGNAGLTFNKSTTTLTANNFIATTTANLGLVGNLTITGGNSGDVLTTNGSGVLSWSTLTTGTTITVDTFTGNGVQTAFTLSVSPSDANYTVATVQGVVQPRSYYTVVGSTLTFSTAPPNTTVVEVTTFSSGSGGGGGGTSSAAAVGYSLVFGG